MGKRGRLYSPEFKEEALRLVYASEKCYPVANIASSCGLSSPIRSRHPSTKRRSWRAYPDVASGGNGFEK